MERVLVVANIGCLAGALWGAWRLWHTPAAEGEQPSFAAVLATAEVASPPPAVPSPPVAAMPEADGPAADRSLDEGRTLGLRVSDRLAIVRNMLQGRSAAETAAATGVSPAQVEAMYRLHGRHGG